MHRVHEACIKEKQDDWMSDVRMVINRKGKDVMDTPFRKLYQVSLLKNDIRFKILLALYISEIIGVKNDKGH